MFPFLGKSSNDVLEEYWQQGLPLVIASPDFSRSGNQFAQISNQTAQSPLGSHVVHRTENNSPICQGLNESEQQALVVVGQSLHGSIQHSPGNQVIHGPGQQDSVSLVGARDCVSLEVPIEDVLPSSEVAPSLNLQDFSSQARNDTRDERQYATLPSIT
ncbi:hypothetical protein V6N13_118554 [Hibiscus sabdariffa]|uniref:Uncharacterized protein n=1 Tax=Hibiscus sabdariffa TaxID=183260 RepID=A0ABR2NWV9_9ROSI